MSHYFRRAVADQLAIRYTETIMSTFVEQLRLAEKAAEDVYFAKVNRELIESLHILRQLEKPSFDSSSSVDARGKEIDEIDDRCF